METSIDYIDYDKAVVSTDEPKWHRRIRAYKEEYPDQVRIKYAPETNDGNMVAEVPVQWIQIRPPKRMNLSDEQRAVLAERMRNTRAKAMDSIHPDESTEDEGVDEQ